MTTEEELDQGTADCPRPMRLEGAEALELYLVEMERNLAELVKQVTMLQAELAERRRLLSQIAARCPEKEAATRPVH